MIRQVGNQNLNQSVYVVDDAVAPPKKCCLTNIIKNINKIGFAVFALFSMITAPLPVSGQSLPIVDGIRESFRLDENNQKEAGQKQMARQWQWHQEQAAQQQEMTAKTTQQLQRDEAMRQHVIHRDL